MCIVIVLCRFDPIHRLGGQSCYPGQFERSRAPSPEPAPPYEKCVIDSVEPAEPEGVQPNHWTVVKSYGMYDRTYVMKLRY
ncbi:hypothetical protein GMOD_00010126 [Pyrenophora seminiperda CCB06]|uniref:Uncharacterized protein n=1 Tax=Pyrenophora seminiperda CCB06 TaxID=1302712 RepID=A0A3M7LZX0_9PLEO|nr:hypothetical protein GMOD_00010126 [Pyrenophora seminiperda CCB06]